MCDVPFGGKDSRHGVQESLSKGLFRARGTSAQDSEGSGVFSTDQTEVPPLDLWNVPPPRLSCRGRVKSDGQCGQES